MPLENIRNFVIIAHIDHGKSTLADRFLELTGTVAKRKMREQFLDQMDLEREKGITIKMQPVRMLWRQPQHAEIPNPKQITNPEGVRQSGPYGAGKSQIQNSNNQNDLEFGAWNLELANSKQEFVLNLIDTPGHVDFSYEVSRALAAVEGAILLVDAGQGVQAQTIANLHLAREERIVIIPVINKIDLPGARVKECEDELVSLLGCRREDIFRISAKNGEGVDEVLAAVVRSVPPPEIAGGDAAGYPRALIFDSHFDSFRGVVAHVRVFNGEFKPGDKVVMLAAGSKAEVMELGYFSPDLRPAEFLRSGEIGYIATGLKEPESVRVGDTITKSQITNHKLQILVEPLPGYREPQPVVFASIYPASADDYARLQDALKKTKLNDASIFFEPESSDALGRGFRAGFLGMLHMEIISERLRREYGLDLIFTTPSVSFLVVKSGGGQEYIYSASRLPNGSEVAEIQEPWARVEIITPQKFLGGVMNLLNSTRGAYVAQEYVGAERLCVNYEVPLKDILVNFFDNLKSVTEGYGSIGYEFLDYRKGDLVRLDILIAGEREETLSQVVPGDKAYSEGKAVVQKLKELLPKQLFAVAIQAAVGGRILARETLPALKKDVTGYLYGGDRTRKMKLWKKQQRGKKRLKTSGRVNIPPSVFMKLLKR